MSSILRRSASLFCGLTLIASASATAAVLDGVRDAEYGAAIGTDASGDLASGGAGSWVGTSSWADLTNIYATNDATHLYVYLDMPSFTIATSRGSFGLAIDTGTVAGGGSDPWGNGITFAHVNKPDVVVRGNLPGSDGWSELRSWNGSSWSGGGTNFGGVNGTTGVGTAVTWNDNDGVEFKVSLASLGLDAGDAVNLLFYSTEGGGNANKGAYDTTPSDDQSTGWDDPTTHTTYAAYSIVPEPASLALLGVGGLFMLRRRTA